MKSDDMSLLNPQEHFKPIDNVAKNKWIGHKAPFIHIGNDVMKCPRCGLEGKGDVFMYVSCVKTEE